MRMLLLCGLALLPALAAAAPPRFTDERHAYLRGEQASLRLRLDAGADAVAFDVGGWLPRRVPVRAGQASYPLDTALLHAGDYDVRAQPLRAGKPLGEVALFPLTIAAERNPQRFPVWNWAGAEQPDLRWWTARGFNGFRFSSTRDPLDPAGEGARRTARILDEGTRLGLDMGAYLYTVGSTRWEQEEAARCLLPDGRRHASKIYPREPVVLDHARRTTEAWVNRFGDYPSFRHALLSSEYDVPFCTNEVAKTLARQEAGLDLAQVLSPRWVRSGASALDPAKLPPELQPQGGLIPDDHPIYRFLKWWWERGHGTSVMNAEMARIIKARRPDVMTWHDPYRLAPVYGSHTGLDCISTWTYGHPDIKRLAYTTVLQAAARRDHQKVMQDITLYVYGRFVVPLGTPTANLLSDQPGRDPFFNQGPDYAREAMWLVMSQRPDALCFYFAGRLQPTNAALDPFISSPETFDAIGEVCRTLVEPYGPAILASRRVKPRVAVLLSASALWFAASPRVPGYINEQILPFCALLMMNHVPFDVLLDDDIAAGRLNDYDALVIPRGDTLTRGNHARIVAFAAAGKKVIADQSLRASVPGAAVFDADFSFERSVDGAALAAGRAVTAEEHRARSEALAERLGPLLAGLPRPAESDSKRVVLNTLESGDIRYLFVTNDERTYGPRFGPWKLMQDAGVRQTARIRLTASGKPALYDALSHQPITSTTQGDQAAFEVTLPPARGRLIAVLPEPVGKVVVTAPATCPRGRRSSIVVSVVGASGRPLAGSVPLQIEVRDPLGRRNEYSRYAATVPAGEAAGGRYQFSLPFLPGVNDLPGDWQVTVTELIGGGRAEHTLSVR
jgi:hypothetical protein